MWWKVLLVMGFLDFLSDIFGDMDVSGNSLQQQSKHKTEDQQQPISFYTQGLQKPRMSNKLKDLHKEQQLFDYVSEELGLKPKEGATIDDYIVNLLSPDVQGESSIQDPAKSLLESAAQPPKIDVQGDYSIAHKPWDFGTPPEEKLPYKQWDPGTPPPPTIQPVDTETLSIEDFMTTVAAEEKKGPDYNILKDTIGDLESKNDYGVVFGGRKNVPIQEMTVDELYKWQTETDKGNSAAGRYQIVPKTLKQLKNDMGLKGDEIFNKELQDKMFMQLLEKRGLNDYLQGQLSDEEFAYNLAKEWAALPYDKEGKSYHGKDGVNKALTDFKTVMEMLKKFKGSM